MIKAFKVIVVSAGLTIALSASTYSSTAPDKDPLQLDNVFACPWWPACRDPDEQKPGPADSSVPKPSGDKDTTKDKKDQTQLA